MFSLALLIFLVKSFEWSCESHMIIWQIAINDMGDQYFSSAVMPLLMRLESPDKMSHYNNIYEHACWADDIKRLTRFEHTFNWHFYDIPYFEVSNEKIDVKLPKENVAWAINIAKSTLLGSTKGYSKSEMLRYLIHFMGDVHQPLHVASKYSLKFPDGDLGGTLFLIKLAEQNLHSLWDTCLGFIQRKMYIRPLEEASIEDIKERALNIQKEHPRSSYGMINITDGYEIAESVHNLTVELAYKGISEGSEPSAEYLYGGRELCVKMIALSGYRLADAIRGSIVVGVKSDL